MSLYDYDYRILRSLVTAGPAGFSMGKILRVGTILNHAVMSTFFPESTLRKYVQKGWLQAWDSAKQQPISLEIPVLVAEPEDRVPRSGLDLRVSGEDVKVDKTPVDLKTQAKALSVVDVEENRVSLSNIEGVNQPGAQISSKGDSVVMTDNTGVPAFQYVPIDSVEGVNREKSTGLPPGVIDTLDKKADEVVELAAPSNVKVVDKQTVPDGPVKTLPKPEKVVAEKKSNRGRKKGSTNKPKK